IAFRENADEPPSRKARGAVRPDQESGPPSASITARNCPAVCLARKVNHRFAHKFRSRFDRSIEYQTIKNFARVDREGFIKREGNSPLQGRDHRDSPDKLSRIAGVLQEKSKLANGACRNPAPARLFPGAFWVKQEYVSTLGCQPRGKVRTRRPGADDRDFGSRSLHREKKV